MVHIIKTKAALLPFNFTWCLGGGILANNQPLI